VNRLKIACAKNMRTFYIILLILSRQNLLNKIELLCYTAIRYCAQYTACVTFDFFKPFVEHIRPMFKMLLKLQSVIWRGV